jgi:hypothetical protein
MNKHDTDNGGAPVNFGMKLDPETLDAFDQWIQLKNREADADVDRAHAERIRANAEATASEEERRDRVHKRETVAIVERAEAEAKVAAIRNASLREKAKFDNELALADIELSRARNAAQAEHAKQLATIFWPMAETLGKGFAELVRIEASLVREELRLIANRDPESGKSSNDVFVQSFAKGAGALFANSMLSDDSHEDTDDCHDCSCGGLEEDDDSDAETPPSAPSKA